MLAKSAELIEIRQKYDKYFHINWNLTNKCNFSCSYCHPYNYTGSSPTFDLDVYKNFVSRILDQLDSSETLVISFTGGEPTAIDIFDDFLVWLVERGVQVGITTNGSRNIKFWEKHKESFRWVSFSFHSERTSIKHAVKVIDTLWPYTLLGVRVMMHQQQEYFDKCVEFFDTLKTEPRLGHFYVEQVPVIDDWLTATEKPHVYTEEQQAWMDNKHAFKRRSANPLVNLKTQYSMPIDATGIFRTRDGRIVEEAILNTNYLYVAQQNKFKGWKCNAGIDGLFVNERGLISGAACLPEGKNENGRYRWLGTIQEPENFVLPSKAIVCNKEACYCNTDLILGKYRDSNY